MIVVHKSSGEVIILGNEQEKLLMAVVDFAIAEGMMTENRQTFMFAGLLDRIKQLKKCLA